MGYILGPRDAFLKGPGPSFGSRGWDRIANPRERPTVATDGRSARPRLSWGQGSAPSLGWSLCAPCSPAPLPPVPQPTLGQALPPPQLFGPLSLQPCRHLQEGFLKPQGILVSQREETRGWSITSLTSSVREPVAEVSRGPPSATQSGVGAPMCASPSDCAGRCTKATCGCQARIWV